MKRQCLNGEKPKDDSGPQFIGYARTSTREQNLDLQMDALNKVGCLNIYVEQISAAKRRPELEKALADLREGDTFVVWRLDRIARSNLELHLRLKAVVDSGCHFRSLTENFDFSSAVGKAFVGMSAVFAEFERNLTIERTRAGIEVRQARGLPHGAPIKFTNEKRKLAKQMLRKGWNGARVAKKVRLAPNTVYKWIKQGKPMLPEAK